MKSNTILQALAVAFVGAFLAACNDEATSPARSAPQLASPEIVTPTLPEPFLARAPLEPFFINQMPEMMLRSSIPTELIVQRLVTVPGPGSWHTHTGPSFSIVDKGTVVIHRYSKKYGCVATAYTEGDTYVEEAGEIHRAEVPPPATAVEYKVRLYTPVGGPLSTPADNPCGTAK